MGDRFKLTEGEKPEISVKVTGTAPLEYIEVMKYSNGESYTWYPFFFT